MKKFSDLFGGEDDNIIWIMTPEKEIVKKVVVGEFTETTYDDDYVHFVFSCGLEGDDKVRIRKSDLGRSLLKAKLLGGPGEEKDVIVTRDPAFFDMFGKFMFRKKPKKKKWYEKIWQLFMEGRGD